MPTIAQLATDIRTRLENGERFSRAEADDAMLILQADSSGSTSTPTAVTPYQQTFTTSDFTAGVLTISQGTHAMVNPVAVVFNTDTSQQALGFYITPSGDIVIDDSAGAGGFNGYINVLGGQ